MDTNDKLDKLQKILGDSIEKLQLSYREMNILVNPENYVPVMTLLCQHKDLQFSQLIDLCAIDYLTYGDDLYPRENSESRYAVVGHLLSMPYNLRIRVKVYLEDNETPAIASLTKVWPVAGWFEREAFDLFGIIFHGNEDLRRILTDYGFIGHPFRKDFPISGNVEITYSHEENRIIQQAVSIAPRENVPRIVRPDGFSRH